jgi:hypothetical protein
MPRVGFESTIPVSERAKRVHVLYRTATVVGQIRYTVRTFRKNAQVMTQHKANFRWKSLLFCINKFLLRFLSLVPIILNEFFVVYFSLSRQIVEYHLKLAMIASLRNVLNEPLIFILNLLQFETIWYIYIYIYLEKCSEYFIHLKQSFVAICSTCFNIKECAFAHRLYLRGSCGSWNKQLLFYKQLSANYSS